jgi:hypothetical protein
VPVEFLSDEEASAYGVYRGVPSQSDLEKLFFLDDADRQLIAKRGGAGDRSWSSAGHTDGTDPSAKINSAAVEREKSGYRTGPISASASSA